MVPRPPKSGSFLTPLLKTPMNRPESEPRAAVVRVIFFCFWIARGVGVRCSPPVGQWGWFQLWGVAARSGFAQRRLRCKALVLWSSQSVAWRSVCLDFVDQNRQMKTRIVCQSFFFLKARQVFHERQNLIRRPGAPGAALRAMQETRGTDLIRLCQLPTHRFIP